MIKKSLNLNENYPLFKLEIEEAILEERKVSEIKIYMKSNIKSEWNLEIATILEKHELGKSLEYIRLLKEKSNLFKKRIVESFSMFSISGIMFSNIKFSSDDKLIRGTLINKELIRYLDITHVSEDKFNFSFSMIERILADNIIFYRLDEEVRIGAFIYKNGEVEEVEEDN